ncbi:MAG: hypothetical protein KGD58_17185 [Candidatus Lokiarchaeota archaeon]|nr:hypothetical protein [Candidatus Lokiarchaeota archaeon]
MSQEEKQEKLEAAMERYRNVRECLTGLYDIMNISFSEKNIMHQAAMDNLINLNNFILEMLRESYTPREIRMRLREIEFDEKQAEEIFPL